MPRKKWHRSAELRFTTAPHADPTLGIFRASTPTLWGQWGNFGDVGEPADSETHFSKPISWLSRWGETVAIGGYKAT